MKWIVSKLCIVKIESILNFFHDCRFVYLLFWGQRTTTPHVLTPAQENKVKKIQKCIFSNLQGTKNVILFPFFQSIEKK